MLKTPLALLCTFLLSSALLADDFIITATNLDGRPITNINEVTVQAFKQQTEQLSDFGINLSVELRRGQLEIPLRVVPSIVSGSLVLRFTISPNDPVLTENGTNRNKAVMLVFFRNGQQLSVVPSLVMTNTVHAMSVGVPKVEEVKAQQKIIECPPQCETQGGLLRRLFRRCR